MVNPRGLYKRFTAEAQRPTLIESLLTEDRLRTAPPFECVFFWGGAPMFRSSCAGPKNRERASLRGWLLRDRPERRSVGLGSFEHCVVLRQLRRVGHIAIGVTVQEVALLQPQRFVPLPELFEPPGVR